MNYNVTWLPAAEAELADIWNRHPDRAAVTRASHELEQDLAARGAAVGESRPNGRRVTFVGPLSATFRVTGRRVTVIRVWSHS